MSTFAISPYRVLPASLAVDFQVKERFEFRSTGPDPGARDMGGRQYSLGTDSDWSADCHDLIVQWAFENVDDIRCLFGEGGVAAPGAELLLALEWTSSDSGGRQLGAPLALSLTNWPSSDGPVMLELRLPPGDVRGIGRLSVQLFLGRPSDAVSSDFGIAVQKGARLGVLAAPVTVAIDGDGSLFPILEQSCGRDGALWELRLSWADPREDTFTADFVALVINRDHELFDQLQDRRPGRGRQTPMMRHVLASWVALLVHEVRLELEGEFDEIVIGASQAEEFASIAETAAEFVRAGELDTSSAHALFASAQRWLDRRIKESEAVE